MERKLLPSASNKRSRVDRDEVLEENALLPNAKKAHSTKEERVASIMEGRDGRGKFGIKKGHEGGTTNKMKDKRKNPKMIAYVRCWLETETLCSGRLCVAMVRLISSAAGATCAN